MISTAPERCRIGRAHVKTWNPLWDSERYHVSAAMPTGAIKFCGRCGETRLATTSGRSQRALPTKLSRCLCWLEASSRMPCVGGRDTNSALHLLPIKASASPKNGDKKPLAW